MRLSALTEAFLRGRPLPDVDAPASAWLSASTSPDRDLALVLQDAAARRLHAAHLAPRGAEAAVRGEVLLAVGAAVLATRGPSTPEVEALAGHVPAETLAADAVYATVTERFAAPGPILDALLRTSPWALLGQPRAALAEADLPRVAGWLTKRALPAASPGGFPLRALLLSPLLATPARERLGVMAGAAPLLEAVEGAGALGHLADFFEGYCAALVAEGPPDREDREAARLLAALRLEDLDDPRRREALRAGRFFAVLARLPGAQRKPAHQLSTRLFAAAGRVAAQLPTTPAPTTVPS